MILLLQVNEYKHNTKELLVFAQNFASQHDLILDIIWNCDVWDYPCCGLDGNVSVYKTIFDYLNADATQVAAVMHPAELGQLFTRQQFPHIQNWYEY